MNTLKNIAESVILIKEQAIGTGQRFKNFKPKADEWIKTRLEKLTKLRLQYPQTSFNNGEYRTMYETRISVPNTFFADMKIRIGWTIKPRDKEYPIIRVFAYLDDGYPSKTLLKQKFPFLTDTQIEEQNDRHHLIWNFGFPNSKGYQSKQELSSRFANEIRNDLKNLVFLAKKWTKEYIIPDIRKNYAGKRAQSKALFLEQIKNDLEEFKRKLSYYDADDISKNGDGFEFGVRDLGNWIDDEESAYEYEDPDSDMYDPSWREDNDNRIWAPGEWKRFYKMFDDWAKTKNWYKKVKLGLTTSEKDWCYFSVRLK